MSFKSYREESKTNWGTSGEIFNNDHIQLGCILRIADAMELMVKDREKMIRELDWYKEAYGRKRDDNDRLYKRISGYKGAITKIKKRLK